MIFVRFLLFFFMILLFFVSTNGQSKKYKKYKFEWPNEIPEPIALDSQFANEDAVILLEECIYNSTGNQTPTYYFLNRTGNYFYIDESTLGKSPVVFEHVRIKYLNKKGILNQSRIVLPQSFDPSGDKSSISFVRRDYLYRPKGEFECIRYFAARIIKPDGKILAAEIDEDIQAEITRINKIDQKFYSWIFNIKNIEINDELEVYYCYEGAFNIDPSSRIFFNGELPKQNYNLTFRHLNKEIYILTYHNNAEPSDSATFSRVNPEYSEYFFYRRNLKGGISESSGRPHIQLPYISFYKHKNDYGIPDSRTGFIKKPLPYKWSYSLIPYIGYQYDDLKLKLNRRDKTTLTLNRFVKEEREKVSDTSLVRTMNSIHNVIANQFDFIRDLEKQNAGDAELEHLGEYVEQKRLREISRYSLYNEIFLRFDRNYFTSFLYDKRISDFDINRYEPTLTMRMVYSLPIYSNYIFYYPKAYRFGYEANELPFYYEGINTVLIPQHEPPEKKTDWIPKVDFIISKTPSSSFSDNYRNTNAVIDIYIDSSLAKFQLKQKLSGQFSTLIRGYYIFGDKDSIINPDYYNSVFNLSNDTDSLDIEPTTFNEQFPFEATFSKSFISERILIVKDDTGKISLRSIFHYVVDDKLSILNRTLDFYPDFQFQDSYKYYFKFDKKIDIINIEELQFDIVNSFARLVLKTTQIDPFSVVIESNYIVKTEFVKANEVDKVGIVYDKIRELKSNTLQFVLKK